MTSSATISSSKKSCALSVESGSLSFIVTWKDMAAPKRALESTDTTLISGPTSVTASSGSFLQPHRQATAVKDSIMYFSFFILYVI